MKARMKTLQDIQDEFWSQRRQEETELSSRVAEAQAEMDALLERAEIYDTPEAWEKGHPPVLPLDDFLFSNDDYSRDCIRETVFSVADVQLRKTS